VAEGQPPHLGRARGRRDLGAARGWALVQRAEDGSEYDWGYVREFDRPDRILLAWHLTPAWKFDPDPAKATEVEVLFSGEEDQTRVTLEHRAFDVHGDAGAAMRESVDSDGGWPSLLEMYRRAA